MDQLHLIEFFAGSRSVGEEAQKLGYNTWSTDIEPFKNIDLVSDIMDITRNDIPLRLGHTGKNCVFWFSPDCSTYSIAACSTHRQYINGVPTPKTEKAKKADKILQKVHEIISWFPDAIYFIENPRGLMRKMPIMQQHIRHTVTYCQYGDIRMKPTDISTNCQTWKPRKICKNGDKCHESAPRGSKTGTQGLKGDYERSKIPSELCKEILEACSKELLNKHKTNSEGE